MSDPAAPRLLALDVDGTLAAPAGGIAEDLLAALRRLPTHDVALVIATGRGWSAMRALATRLHPATYLALNNGTVICRAGAGPVLRARHLDLATGRKVVEEFEALELHPIWVDSPYVGYTYRVGGAWWDHPAAAAYLRPKAGSVRHLPHLRRAAPPVEIFAFGDRAEVALAEGRLHAELGDAVSTVSWWSDRLQSAAVEALPPGVTKGEAVAWLAAELDLKSDVALAVGDDRNDIEMLQWAGRSVAIAGAPPEVIAVADRVMDQDGEGAVRRLVRDLWAV